MDTTTNRPLPSPTPSNYLEAFYLLLWHQDQPPTTCPEKSKFRIRIPSTILIKDKCPYNWFFSNGKDVLKREKQENLNPENIYKEFCSDKLDTDIVAARYTLGEHEQTHIEYLDKKYFDDNLIGDPENVSNIFTAEFSVLQKYLRPIGSKENIIVCDWSNSLCRIKRIENDFEFYNKFCAKIQKHLTWSAPDGGSSEFPVCDPKIIDAISQTCVEIRDKFLNDTFGCLHLNRMLLTFKLDESQNLQFLWPSKIRKMLVHENFAELLDCQAIHTWQAIFREDTGSLDHRDPCRDTDEILAAEPNKTKCDS